MCEHINVDKLGGKGERQAGRQAGRCSLKGWPARPTRPPPVHTSVPRGTPNRCAAPVPILRRNHKALLILLHLPACSYGRNSCARNHSRYTSCAAHHNEGHGGAWKDCQTCK